MPQQDTLSQIEKAKYTLVLPTPQLSTLLIWKGYSQVAQIMSYNRHAEHYKNPPKRLGIVVPPREDDTVRLRREQKAAEEFGKQLDKQYSESPEGKADAARRAVTKENKEARETAKGHGVDTRDFARKDDPKGKGAAKR